MEPITIGYSLPGAPPLLLLPAQQLCYWAGREAKAVSSLLFLPAIVGRKGWAVVRTSFLPRREEQLCSTYLGTARVQIVEMPHSLSKALLVNA